jgi:hypothetical protein
MTDLVRPNRLGVDGSNAPGWPIVATRLSSDRQLQHRGLLSRMKVGEQDDAAVRKLEGIVVPRRMVHIQLTEAGEPTAGRAPLEKTKERPAPLDIAFKR